MIYGHLYITFTIWKHMQLPCNNVNSLATEDETSYNLINIGSGFGFLLDDIIVIT